MQHLEYLLNPSSVSTALLAAYVLKGRGLDPNEERVQGVSRGLKALSWAQAIAVYHKNKIEFGPAKAANAGGVAVSGLEMAQNSARMAWSSEEVDEKLKGIMSAIFNAAKSVRLTPLFLGRALVVALHSCFAGLSCYDALQLLLCTSV